MKYHKYHTHAYTFMQIFKINNNNNNYYLPTLHDYINLYTKHFKFIKSNIFKKDQKCRYVHLILYREHKNYFELKVH